MPTFINLNKTNKKTLVFDKKGEYVIFLKNLSGKFSFQIKKKYVKLKIFALYRGKNKDSFSLETEQIHYANFSSSSLLIKGVFDNSAHFFHQGLIRIEKNLNQIKAFQKNENLILSDNCSLQSKPFLEILSNDVQCSHESTISCPNKSTLYYLKSRGINDKEAINLISKGFLEEIENKIEY